MKKLVKDGDARVGEKRKTPEMIHGDSEGRHAEG